jgi:hypothetical protein
MNDTLVTTLAKIGKIAEAWTSADGSTLVVLPYGGRILGLFAPGSDHNFLWTHPALTSVGTAESFYQGSEWHNSGGDRTWISPEVDFFLPNYPSLDVYRQPRELDPGQYQLSRKNGSIFLSNTFASRLSRSNHTAHLELTRQVSAAHNPLRSIRYGSFDRLEYAGYSLRTHLAFTSGRAEPVKVGLWSLLQLPHGGELFIPTLSKTKVNICFGKVDTQDLTVTDRLIRYKMRAAGEHKLGLEAATVVGRAGYLKSMGSNSSLVIRNFFINPSGEYIDVPWDEPDGPGAAVQACNVDSKLGSFSELEYHVPAIGGPSGNWKCVDESQVWAFRGPDQTMVQVARLLLSSDI